MILSTGRGYIDPAWFRSTWSDLCTAGRLNLCNIEWIYLKSVFFFACVCVLWVIYPFYMIALRCIGENLISEQLKSDQSNSLEKLHMLAERCVPQAKPWFYIVLHGCV